MYRIVSKINQRFLPFVLLCVVRARRANGKKKEAHYCLPQW